MIDYLVASIGVIGTLLAAFSLLCAISCGAALLVAYKFFGNNEDE